MAIDQTPHAGSVFAGNLFVGPIERRPRWLERYPGAAANPAWQQKSAPRNAATPERRQILQSSVSNATRRAAAAPRESKDDLRAQVEKLERANANLRAKNKELRQAATEAAQRIDELEVGRHERRAAKTDPSAARRKPARQPKRSRPNSDADPAPPAPAAETVREPELLSEAD